MSLSLLTGAVGLFLTALYGYGLKQPEGLKTRLFDYPRSDWPGRLLTAVSLPWAAYFLIITPPVAGNSGLEKLVMLLTPVAFVLVLKYLDELLSVRALGGFLLLLATPLMKSARLHDSGLSVIVTLFAYLIAIKGMVFVLSPFRFRHGVEWLTKTPGRFKPAMITGTAFGILLLLLSLFVY